MEFWIPRGANRFHFTGASRFVHGGAMLQEVVVPVVTVRHRKGKAAEETKLVTVRCLQQPSDHQRSANPDGGRQRQVKPITLKVAIYEGEPVTDLQTVARQHFRQPGRRKKWNSS
jgi:hypothetical protein